MRPHNRFEIAYEYKKRQADDNKNKTVLAISLSIAVVFALIFTWACFVAVKQGRRRGRAQGASEGTEEEGEISIVFAQEPRVD